MFVAIIGSRPDSWENQNAISRRITGFVTSLAAKYPDCVVVSGGARGVDSWAERDALSLGLGLISYRPIPVQTGDGSRMYSILSKTWGVAAHERVVATARRIAPPHFSSYGQAAFHRNTWIIEDADQVVAFWDGKSRGTGHSIEIARRRGKPVHIYS